MRKTLEREIGSVKDINVLIVGDVILDTYVFGDINRISPEAPIPILDYKETQHYLGGAANVALKVKELGANPILLSAMGTDFASVRAMQIIREKEIIEYVVFDGQTIPEKIRYISMERQILRVDKEQRREFDEYIEEIYITNLGRASRENIDVIIVSDYNKGCITFEIFYELLKLKKPILVDPKNKLFTFYEGCTWIKPNEKEACKLDKLILEDTEAERLFVTMGGKGIRVTCKTRTGWSTEIIAPKRKVEIVDPTGAGDAVCAVLGLCLAKEVPDFTAAKLANIAGGMICEQFGNGSFCQWNI